MQRREKLLFFALVAVVLLSQGIPVVERVFFEPVDARKAQIRRLDEQLDEQADRQLEIHRSKKNLRQWRGQSLPPDSRNAQRLYQEWLTDLAKAAGFSELKVTPGRRSRKSDVYVVVQVSVDAMATFEQLCTFLYRFRTADLLHRVANLNVDSQKHEGNPRLKISVTAEGLSLSDAPKRNQLFPQTELKEEVSTKATGVTVTETDSFPKSGEYRIRIGDEFLSVNGDAGQTWEIVHRGVASTTAASHPAGEPVVLARVNRVISYRPLEDYSTIPANSPFVKPSQPIEPAKLPPSKDVARQTVLTSSVARGGERWAWLTDQPSNKQLMILHEGMTFTVADIHACVVSIGRDFVLLSIDDETWRLKLGKDLRSLEKLATPPATDAEDSAAQSSAETPQPPANDSNATNSEPHER